MRTTPVPAPAVLTSNTETRTAPAPTSSAPTVQSPRNLEAVALGADTGERLANAGEKGYYFLCQSGKLVAVALMIGTFQGGSQYLALQRTDNLLLVNLAGGAAKLGVEAFFGMALNEFGPSLQVANPAGPSYRSPRLWHKLFAGGMETAAVFGGTAAVAVAGTLLAQNNFAQASGPVIAGILRSHAPIQFAVTFTMAGAELVGKEIGELGRIVLPGNYKTKPVKDQFIAAAQHFNFVKRPDEALKTAASFTVRIVATPIVTALFPWAIKGAVAGSQYLASSHANQALNGIYKGFQATAIDALGNQYVKWFGKEKEADGAENESGNLMDDLQPVDREQGQQTEDATTVKPVTVPETAVIAETPVQVASVATKNKAAKDATPKDPVDAPLPAISNSPVTPKPPSISEDLNNLKPVVPSSPPGLGKSEDTGPQFKISTKPVHTFDIADDPPAPLRQRRGKDVASVPRRETEGSTTALSRDRAVGTSSTMREAKEVQIAPPDVLTSGSPPIAPSSRVSKPQPTIVLRSPVGVQPQDTAEDTAEDTARPGGSD